jgi:hypothetical protein
MEVVIYRNTNTLRTFAHAEGAAQLNLIAQFVLGNQILELLNNLARAFDVAGATDTNRNFKHDVYLSIKL